MTTSYYRVAYPHPLLRPLNRCCLCEVGPRTNKTGLLAQLYESYPGCVDDLKFAILWKAGDLSEADAWDRSTKKVYDWIDRQSDEAELPSSRFIAESFPDGPHEHLLNKVDIVVVTPEILEAMHGDAAELGYIKARDEAFIGIKRGSAPSDCVKSFSGVKETLSDPHGPRYGRPSDRFGPPTALFSKPLALLKRELGHLESFTPDAGTLEKAFQLIAISTNSYGDEKLRETVLRPALESLLSGDIKWQQPTPDKAAKPEGAWFEGIFTYLILELKNEQGLSGDPFLQGLITYGKIISQENYRPYLKRSNLPAILLAIAGNRLVVSTAIFTNEVYADELLSVTLRFGSHASDNVFFVARVFMAINKAKMELSDLYRKLPQILPSSLSPAIALWPNPTTDPPESIPKLEFFAKVDRATGTPLLRIDEENERHAMYLARKQTETLTQEVFVKFSTQYHEDAHRLLAEQNPPLAPALHFCARVVGGMYMVIMDYIPQSMGRSVDLYSSGPVLPQDLPQVVERDVSKALSLLHAKNWVFGDLREPNMLYLPGSHGEGRLLLIDFDAVGVDGEARYSACLNPAARFCASVQRGQIMKKGHDFENLEEVLGRLTKAMDDTALTEL